MHRGSGLTRAKPSTFFPQSWTEARLGFELAAAFKRADAPPQASPEQIEEQMRLSGNKNRGVSANTLEHWDVATQPGYNADPGLSVRAVPGTTQVIEVVARPDWEIQQYIVSSTTTGGGTNGVPPWTPYTPSRGGTAPINPPDAPTARFANGRLQQCGRAGKHATCRQPSFA